MDPAQKHAALCIAPIMVFATVLVADAIIFREALACPSSARASSPSTPTWVNMLSEGRLLLSGAVADSPVLLILICHPVPQRVCPRD